MIFFGKVEILLLEIRFKLKVHAMRVRMHKEFLKPLFLDYNVSLGWMFLVVLSLLFPLAHLKKIVDCNV